MKPLERAIVRAGSQSELARALGVRQQDVHRWLHANKKGVPAEYCGKIEILTGVPRRELRPDIDWGL